VHASRAVYSTAAASATAGLRKLLDLSARRADIPRMAHEKSRLWLMVPSRLITRPLLHEMGKNFDVIPNVRQASVTTEVGIVSIELDGEREEKERAIRWLEELGVKVEPVEINTIEG
jgi:ABC-type methionine transport system ATPase subunit